MARRNRDMQDRPQYTAAAFRAALPFLNHLRECKDRLTTQELSALRAQALDGDIDGAMAALEAAIDGADDWDGAYDPERERYIREHMAKVPTVDALLIVRCKDCMYFRPWRHDRGEDSRCEFWNAEIGAEDYCSQAIYLNNKMDGERRDGDA